MWKNNIKGELSINSSISVMIKLSLGNNRGFLNKSKYKFT